MGKKGKDKCLEIIYSPVKTATNFIRSMKQSVELLHYFLVLDENKNEPLPDTLKNENDNFLKTQVGNALSTQELSLMMKKKLITNALEEMIKGVNLSLMDAYVSTSMRIWFEQKQVCTLTESDSQFAKLETKANKFNFPSIINELERILNTKFHREEIQTINKVRNCLTHRDGLVTTLDVNNSEKNKLILYYRSFFIALKSDSNKEIIGPIRVKQGDSLTYKIIKSKKEFCLGDKISFTYKEIQDIAMSCYFFINQLVKAQINLFKKASNEKEEK